MKEKTIEYYLEFLRYSLNANSTVVPQCASEIQWHDLLAFAKSHAIVGIYWQGILKMMSSENRPELKYWTGGDDVLAWMAQVQKIKINNTRLYNRSVQICRTFAENGFASCVLKGQGNALMYPDPYMRTSGDIDIWVWPKISGKLKLENLFDRRKEIVKYVCNVCRPREVEYHHVDFPIYKDAPVEAHFTPSYFESPFNNSRLQKWLEKESLCQMDHQIEAPDGIGKFNVPTLQFNLFYQILHLDKHFRFEGIGLRQIIDYYYLLKKAHEEGINTAEVIKSMKSFHVLKFTKAIMYIMHNTLGLPMEYLFVAPDEKEGKFVLGEILRAGNFGKYDNRVKDIHNTTGHLKRYLKREKLNVRLFMHNPREVVWSPFFNFFIHYFIKYWDRKMKVYLRK